MTWEPKTKSDRFELRKRLGEGSFGVVFEAWDREREARVALKEKVTVRPPDEAKLGEKQPAKSALAGKKTLNMTHARAHAHT